MTGKKIGHDFYIHANSIDYCKPKYHHMLYEAVSINNNIKVVIKNSSIRKNLVYKFNEKNKKVSILFYPNFESLGHPLLFRSICVSLEKKITIVDRSYKQNNKAVLHRKELLVHSGHELYLLFKELSEKEKKENLLGKSNIGYKTQWESLLKNKGLKITGNRLETA